MLSIALRLAEPEASMRKWVSDLKDLLHSRYEEHVSPDTLARHLGIHPASSTLQNYAVVLS